MLCLDRRCCVVVSITIVWFNRGRNRKTPCDNRVRSYFFYHASYFNRFWFIIIYRSAHREFVPVWKWSFHLKRRDLNISPEQPYCSKTNDKNFKTDYKPTSRGVWIKNKEINNWQTNYVNLIDEFTNEQILAWRVLRRIQFYVFVDLKTYLKKRTLWEVSTTVDLVFRLIRIFKIGDRWHEEIHKLTYQEILLTRKYHKSD